MVAPRSNKWQIWKFLALIIKPIFLDMYVKENTINLNYIASIPSFDT